MAQNGSSTPTIGIGRDFDGVCGIHSAPVECQLGMIQVCYLHGIPEYTYGSRLHRVAVAEVSVCVRSRIHAFFRLLAVTIKHKILILQQNEGKVGLVAQFSLRGKHAEP
jgi:hypothetical protein